MNNYELKSPLNIYESIEKMKVNEILNVISNCNTTYLTVEYNIAELHLFISRFTKGSKITVEYLSKDFDFKEDLIKFLKQRIKNK